MSVTDELRRMARELRGAGRPSFLRRGHLDAADRLERRACEVEGADGPCGGCGGRNIQRIPWSPNHDACRDCGDSWERADADPLVEKAIEEITANRDAWRDAAIARGCLGLPDVERER